MQAIKLIICSFWSALCLWGIEFVFCLGLAESLYLVEGYFTTYHSGVIGVTIGGELFREWRLIFVSIPIVGFTIAIAIVITFCSLLGFRLRWWCLSGLNVLSLMLSLAIWDQSAHILSSAMHLQLPVYSNIILFLPLSALLSPLILHYAKILGTRSVFFNDRTSHRPQPL
jgi:hypothetical protein